MASCLCTCSGIKYICSWIRRILSKYRQNSVCVCVCRGHTDWTSNTVECRYNAVQYCKNISWSITGTGAEYQSDAGSTKDTPYLALTGELWGVFCENLWENWSRYNDTAPYCAHTPSFDDTLTNSKSSRYIPHGFSWERASRSSISTCSGISPSSNVHPGSNSTSITSAMIHVRILYSGNTFWNIIRNVAKGGIPQKSTLSWNSTKSIFLILSCSIIIITFTEQRKWMLC